MFRIFLSDESGAITVDYVVLTAGVTGLGMAVVATIAPVLADLSQAIMDELATTTVEGSFDDDTLVTLANDFATQSDDWSGASISNVPGFGSVLGPIGGSQGLESVSATFDVPAEATQAQIELDLLAFDSLDSEDAVLYIDGQIVGRMTSTAGVLSFAPTAGLTGITVEADIVASGQPIGGMQTGPESWWNDGIAAITITVDDPSDTVSFGMGSTADQGVSDESWGLDNVVFSAI